MPIKSKPVVFLLLAFSIIIVGTIAVAFLLPKQADNGDSPRRFRIFGGSMANGFLGRHYEIECADCRFIFHCDFHEPPHDRLSVCPNCGFEKNQLRDELVRDADLADVDETAFANRQPQRWEVVAFRTPGDEQTLSVKRVVGVPGERVAIRNGDIFIDGRILRKSLEALRNVAILVHDNSFRPTLDEKLPRRWRAESTTTAWRAEAKGFSFARKGDDPNAAADSSQFDWLVYHHWPCIPSLGARAIPSPVKDNYAYNQGLTRKLHVVADLLLSCRMRLNNWDLLAVRIHDGHGPIDVQLAHKEKTIRLLRDTAQIAEAPLPVIVTEREVTLDVALCDARILVAIDGHELIQQNLEPSDKPFRPSSAPLAFRAAGRDLSLQHLQVYRDIHYLDAAGTGREWSVDLSGDRFLVLGDNVPISVDSRSWADAGLPHKLLIGKVLKSSPKSN